jgi:hypothetical protein
MGWYGAGGEYSINVMFVSRDVGSSHFRLRRLQGLQGRWRSHCKKSASRAANNLRRPQFGGRRNGHMRCVPCCGVRGNVDTGSSGDAGHDIRMASSFPLVDRLGLILGRILQCNGTNPTNTPGVLAIQTLPTACYLDNGKEVKTRTMTSFSIAVIGEDSRIPSSRLSIIQKSSLICTQEGICIDEGEVEDSRRSGYNVARFCPF